MTAGIRSLILVIKDQLPTSVLITNFTGKATTKTNN